MKNNDKKQFNRLMSKLERGETLTEIEVKEFIRLSACDSGAIKGDAMRHRVGGSYGSRQ